MATEREKMLRGEPYLASDPELVAAAVAGCCRACVQCSARTCRPRWTSYARPQSPTATTPGAAVAHVASVRIDTNLMFSDVYIETTGGASPIKCHGHKKTDAVRMKQLIEQYQTEYYKGPVGGGGSPVVPEKSVR